MICLLLLRILIHLMILCCDHFVAAFCLHWLQKACIWGDWSVKIFIYWNTHSRQITESSLSLIKTMNCKLRLFGLSFKQFVDEKLIKDWWAVMTMYPLRAFSTIHVVKCALFWQSMYTYRLWNYNFATSGYHKKQMKLWNLIQCIWAPWYCVNLRYLLRLLLVPEVTLYLLLLVNPAKKIVGRTLSIMGWYILAWQLSKPLLTFCIT